MTSVRPREWDSAFFGYPVAAVSFAAPPSPVDVRAAIAEAQSAGTRLLYLFLPPIEAALRRAIEQEGAKAMGRKVDYGKDLRLPVDVPAGDDVVPCRESTPQLERLALQSGIYSRFRLDDGFRNREFERLYGEWLASSLRGDDGKRTYIAGDLAAPRGLITVEPGTGVRIGLLAVEVRQRGQGLGHRLVAEAERFARQYRFAELRVATQAENPAACRLYESCGFRRVSEIEIFHAWLTPPLQERP